MNKSKIKDLLLDRVIAVVEEIKAEKEVEKINLILAEMIGYDLKNGTVAGLLNKCVEILGWGADLQITETRVSNGG